MTTTSSHHAIPKLNHGTDAVIDAGIALTRCQSDGGKATLREMADALAALEPDRVALHGTAYDEDTERFVDPDPISETIARYLLLPPSIVDALNLGPLIDQSWRYWRAVAQSERHDRDK